MFSTVKHRVLKFVRKENPRSLTESGGWCRFTQSSCRQKDGMINAVAQVKTILTTLKDEPSDGEGVSPSSISSSISSGLLISLSLL